MFKRIPNSYVLLFYIIIFLGIASYIIPAGIYDREIDKLTGINYVVPNSYHAIENTPVSIFDIFKAIPDGMMGASDIIIFVLMVGGCLGIIQATGTTDALIISLAKKYDGNEKTIIILIMTLFSLSGSVLGTAEEALPLYPIIISLSLTMGFDKLTGVAMVLLGTGAGFAAGVLNPFTTGIAQSVSELPLFSGIGLRIIAHIIFLSSAIIFVLRYISKNGKCKTRNSDGGGYIEEMPRLDLRQKAIIIVIILLFIVLIIGIQKFKFAVLEIITLLLIMAIVCGLIGGLRPGRISSEFVKGASNMAYGALIIGLANGINVIMNYGNIMDTVICALSKTIEGYSPAACIIGMLLIHMILNVFISSGSGQAAAVMPIMKEVANLSGITRQSAVLALQFGDGFTNLINPTSGYFMAALALGDIEWNQWVKWFYPLFLIWCFEGALILIISTIMNYGPY